jgi:hypothetical protein
MKQKLILGFSVLLLLAVIVLIGVDFFKGPPKERENPEIYSIDKLRKIDSSQICYVESIKRSTSLSDFKGIAIDDNLNVFVCSDREVQVYDKDWKKMHDFMVDSNVCCMALGEGGEIYLAMENHIEVFNLSGNRLAKWKIFNDLSLLTSLVAIGDDIYAADAGNKIVLRYDRKGDLFNTIGGKDKEKGVEGFIIPSLYFDVAAGPDHDLWVANTGRHELQNFSPQGDLVSSWGVASMQLEGFAGCCNPVHFAILPDGFFVTYEKGLDRIKLYNQGGKYSCVVSGPAKIDRESLTTCSVSSPVHDLAVDKEGKIYALDGESMRVRIFIRKKTGGSEQWKKTTN